MQGNWTRNSSIKKNKEIIIVACLILSGVLTVNLRHDTAWGSVSPQQIAGKIKRLA
jgi:hypothetical protein